MFGALALDTRGVRQINKQITIITTHKDFLRICTRFTAQNLQHKMYQL